MFLFFIIVEHVLVVIIALILLLIKQSKDLAQLAVELDLTLGTTDVALVEVVALTVVSLCSSGTTRRLFELSIKSHLSFEYMLSVRRDGWFCVSSIDQVLLQAS